MVTKFSFASLSDLQLYVYIYMNSTDLMSNN